MATTLTSNNKSLLIAFLGGAAAGVTLIAFLYRNRSWKTPHPQPNPNLTDSEQWIQQSILSSMPPAVHLGIGIEKLVHDGSMLSLSMPLKGNTNVHGTAFAGSLYSLAALSAWYLMVHYLREEQKQTNVVVVLKSASIAYKRPITSPQIMACSVLPSPQVLETFWHMLTSQGKATITVHGTIPGFGSKNDSNKPSVEYTAILCALKSDK